MSEKEKLLVICGPSGSGKSHLQRDLETRYPEKFVRLEQFTTRAQRPNDDLDSYIFVSDEADLDRDRYMIIDIIGRTEINGAKYGTLLGPTAAGQVGMAVLNRMGIDSLNQSEVLKTGYEVKIVKVLPTEDVELPAREGRSEDFLKDEVASLEGVEDLTVYRTADGFADEVYEQIYNLVN